MNKHAFTLVELMVVVAILGVLSAVVVPSYRNYLITSKVATVMPLIQADLRVVEQYFEAYGVPASSADITAMNNAITLNASSSPYINTATILDQYGLHFNVTGSDLPAGMAIKLRYVTDPAVTEQYEWHCRYGGNTTAVVNTGVTNGDSTFLPGNCQTLIGSPTWY